MKQSSSKLSTLAAGYLAKGREGILEMMHEDRQQLITDMLSVCASVVSQDEAKGQKPRK